MPRGGKREGAGRKSKGEYSKRAEAAKSIKVDKRPDLNPRARAQISNKIKSDWLIQKLNAHIDNPDGKMVPSAVTAALGLLRKKLPDLQAIEHSGEIKQPVEVMSDADLDQRIARTSALLAGEEAAPNDPSKLN